MRVIDKNDVPEFSDIFHFTEWYLGAGTPVAFPENPEVFVSDDAAAFCLFRSGRYQMELYLVHPNADIPLHEHPGVQNIEVPNSGWHDASLQNLKKRLQKPGMVHGPRGFASYSLSGFALYSAQKWDEGIEMSTIGARWKGRIVGPKHEALIRRFNPNCFIQDGYADVTKLVA